MVVFHFDDFDYSRFNEGGSFDPSTITFRGSPGFWYTDEEGRTNGVAFAIRIRTNTPFTIQGSDFRFPSLPDVGEFGQGYSHHLSFRGFGNKQALKIKWEGVDITGKTTNTIVGQRIRLSTELASGLTASHYEWTLPSMVVSDFVATASSGHKIDLAETDLTKANVSFAWVNKGVKQVSCVVTLTDGVYGPAFTSFSVERPPVIVTTTTGVVSVDSDCGDPELHFGCPSPTPGVPGITFTNIQSGLSTGSNQWVQLIHKHRRVKLNNGQWQSLEGDGLDTDSPPAYPYAFGPATQDSPSRAV